MNIHETDPGTNYPGKEHKMPAALASVGISVLFAGAICFACYLYRVNPAMPALAQAAGLLGLLLVISLLSFLPISCIWHARCTRLGWRGFSVYTFLSLAAAAGAVSLIPAFPSIPENRSVSIEALEEKNERSLGGTFRVVHIQSDLAGSDSARFETSGNWTPFEDGFQTAAWGGDALLWSGRFERHVTVSLEASPGGGTVLIRWQNHTSEKVDLYADSARVITVSHDFPVSGWNWLLVRVLTGLPFFIAAFLALAFAFPQPLLSSRFLEGRNGIRLVAVAGLAIGLLDILENSGLLREYTLRDSSVFLYGGENILSGGVPYRDVWDHKGPLIYLINAAGLALGGGSRLGVFVLECFFLLAIISLIFLSMEKTWGWAAGFGSSVIVLAGFNRLYDGGNLTEEYAAAFQAASILLFILYMNKPTSWKVFWIGFLAALGFLLRPNLISTQGAAGGLIWLSALVGKDKSSLSARRILFTLAGGFLVPVAGAIVLFARQNALGDMLEQMLTFNLLYSRNSGVAALEQLLIPWKVLRPLWITPVVIAGFLVGLFGILKETNRLSRCLILLGCLDFAAGLVIYNASGRGFRHYFLNILPASGVLVGYLTWKITGLLRPRLARLIPGAGIKALFSAGIVGWAVINLVFYLPDIAADARLVGQGSPKCTFLDEELGRGEKVLMWGIETPFYISSGRQAPTRFIYQTAIIQPWYGRAEHGYELVDALEKDKTPILIDTSPTNSEFPPLSGEPGLAGAPGESPAVPIIQNYIQDHYQLDGTLPCYGEGWLMYRRVP